MMNIHLLTRDMTCNRPCQTLCKALLVLFLFYGGLQAQAIVPEKQFEMVEVITRDKPVPRPFYFDKTGTPRGGVILLHEPGGKSRDIANIAYYLSDHGWSTLVLEMGLPAGEPQEGAIGYLSDSLLAAISFMQQQKGQYNLVTIALSNSWPLLLDIMARDGWDNDLIQAYISLDSASEMSLQTLPPERPILDLVTGRQEQAAQQERRIQARRFKLQNYTPLIMKPPVFLEYLHEDRLTRRLRGWLQTHVQGIEVDLKNLQSP
ncbi:MAG: DUF3530 family protein [Pseudomonadales bacterium]|nr:DUF3530 family protein [Pseudomonadales bacterium]